MDWPGGAERLLVSRERELVAVDGAIGRLSTHAASYVCISGEPGIGKTRLLGELCRRAEGRGQRVLAGRGAEFERDIPFAVWVDALDDYVGTLGPERVRRLVGELAVELAGVLPGMSAGPGAGAPALREERYRAYRAVRALLDALARQRPLVVALDDLHWADVASLELVAHLLRRPSPAPVLIALAFRTGQLPPALVAALEAAGRDGVVTELALAPLAPDEAGALLGGGLDPAVQAELYRQSGGNPFYLDQLVRAGPRLSALDGVDRGLAGVPAAVAAALGEEIAVLSEPARLLAQGAAVAGEPVEFELAAAAADLDERAALAAVDQLLAAGVLRGSELPRRYRFRHPIVRRAVYEVAAESWRFGAHARAATALEARGGALTARAHHLERCARVGDEAAIGVLVQAAREVTTRAPASAAGWLRAALRLLPGTAEARRLELLVPLAMAQAAAGELEAALATLEDALARVPAELGELRSRLVATCAASENLLGRHAAAHARLRRALTELGELSPAAAGVLQAELAADAYWESDFEAMRLWAERAEASAVAAADPGLSAVTAALRCFAAASVGDAEAAETARAEGADRFDALSDEQLAGRLQAPYYLGFAEYWGCERYDDPIRHLRRGIKVARATGQGQFLAPMMNTLAPPLAARGSLPEANEVAEAAVDAARLAGNPQLLSWALATNALVAAIAGERASALAAADEAVELLDGLDASVVTRRHTHVYVGAALLEAGDFERGLEQLQLGGAPDFSSILPTRRAWCFAYLARTDLRRGRPAAAERWLARGEQALGGQRLLPAEAALLEVRASLLLARDEPRAASLLALEAAERAAAVGARLQAARARTVAGRALAAAGERAQAETELQRAEAELAACGALPLRDEAARELRRLGRRVPTRARRARSTEGLEALSGREREIATLVAHGHTNGQIAARLFLSEKTIEGHLTNVFVKLGVRSRAEVAEAVGRAGADHSGRPRTSANPRQ